MKLKIVLLTTFFLSLLGANRSDSLWASTPSIPTVDLNSLIPLPAVSEIIKITSNLSDHRPYRGALPLWPNHIDLGIEASLIHLPDQFEQTFSQAGLNVNTSSLPALPIPKIRLQFGLGSSVDIGFSGLYYKGNAIIGVGLQTLIFRPEEGLSWALRGNYSNTELNLAQILGSKIKALPIEVNGIEIGSGNISLGTQSASAELVASQKLDFAEPYIGTGIHWLNGQVSGLMSLNILTKSQTLYSPAYSFYNFNLFTGVSFQTQILGLRFDLEGAYSSLGMHYFGIVTGVGI